MKILFFLPLLCVFLFSFIANIECPNPKSTFSGKSASENFTAFGIKHSEVEQHYAEIFIHKKSDNIQWQIGAFLLDRFLHQIEQNNILELKSISSIRSLSGASSTNSARGRRKENSAKKNKDKMTGKGKERKEGEEGNEEAEKLLKRKKIEEFAEKFSQYKKEAKNAKIGSKNVFGFEELLGLFKNLFLNELFVENSLEKFDQKIKMEWNLKSEIEMSKSEAKKIETIGKYLRLILRSLHREELAAFLAGTNKENKLYKGMQELGEEKKGAAGEAEEIEHEKRGCFEFAKEKMRAMVGADWVYKHLEMSAPILMRIDIIEPTEMLRMYKKMLSMNALSKQKDSFVSRSTLAKIFGKIWTLRRQKVGVRERLLKLWKEKKSGKEPDENDLMKLWMEILGFVEPKEGEPEYAKEEKKYSDKKKELEGEIEEMEKKKMIEIYKKFGEFKEFLDKNEGSRGRIAKILDCENEIGKILMESGEMAEMLRIEPNEEEMEEAFLKNYLKVFASKEELERKKSVLKIFILLGVEFLNGQFASMSNRNEEDANLEKKWATNYRPMYFFFNDQMADPNLDWEFCEENVVPLRNVLYIFMQFTENANRGKMNLDEELKRELVNSLEENGGNGVLIDVERQMEILRGENAKVIPKLVEKYAALKTAIDELHFENEDDIFNFLIREVQDETTTMHRELIEDYSSWNSNFLDGYKSYLEKGEKTQKYELNLDATLWHYKKIFTNLKAKIVENANLSRDLDSLLDYMAVFASVNPRGKCFKLCKLHFFFQNTLLLAKDEIQKLPEWKEFESLSPIGVFPEKYCENNSYAVTIASEIVFGLKGRKNVYFDYLDWLLMNSVDFQQFLLKTNKNFKENIVNLLAVEEAESSENRFELLDKLEKMHPEWLRIDEMHEGMRLNLYKLFMQTKSYQKKSEEIERRISMSLMIDGIKKAKNASTNFGLAAENATLFKRMQAKIDEILAKAYEKNGEKFDSMENVCLLARFKQMINLVTIQDPEGGDNNIYYLQSTGKEGDFLKYDGSLCKYEAIQIAFWRIQRAMHQYDHMAFFNTKLSELAPFIEQFGGLLRMILLIPNLKYNDFVKNRDFSIDSNFRQHLKNAIFAQNSEDELANQMAAGFFSWIRHLDSKIEEWLNTEAESNMKTDPKILHEVWQSTKDVRKELIVKCDMLGDMNWKRLLQTKKMLARMSFDILAFVDEAREEKVYNKEELEQTFAAIVSSWGYGEYNEKWTENEMQKKLVEYQKWVEKLLGEEFLEQLSLRTDVPDLEQMIERVKFANELKKHLEKGTKERKSLYHLLGLESNVIEKVLEKLNVKIEEEPNEKEEIEEKIENWEEEEKGKMEAKELKEVHDLPNIERKKEQNERGKEIQQNILEESLKINKEEGKNSSYGFEYSALEGEGMSKIERGEKSSKSTKLEELSSKSEDDAAQGKGVQIKEKIEGNLKIKNIKNIAEYSKKETHKQIATAKTFSIEKIREDEEKRKEIEAKRRERKEKEKENKKARKQRKIAQKMEIFRKKALVRAKILESTAKEQKKQINTQLIVEGLVNLLREKGYGEFPDTIKNANENEAKRMANRRKYLNQSEFAILNVMEMLAKWNKESRLLISGSNQLQLNTNESDIDLIVLIPYDPTDLNANWAMEFEKNFIGNSKVKCKISERKCGENDDDNLLYCFLCKEKKINSIKKIASHIPLIKMNYKRVINFDINMALVQKDALPGRHFPTIQRQLNLIKGKKLSEKMEIIQKKQPSFEQIDEMIKKIIAGVGRERMEAKGKIGEKETYGNDLGPQITAGVHRFMQSRAMVNKENQDGREGMVLVFSGYRANKQMAKLLGEGKEETEKYRNFQIATLALKFWAKNHFIYNGIFGFLNGATLAVMVCKLAMESGENASALTLLEQFFKKYHKIGNEMLEPIELNFERNYPEIRNSLDWTMEREEAARNRNRLGWQVITAGFPTQNSAFTILPSTGRIINAEMETALKKVEKAQKLVEMPQEVEANEIKEFLGEFLLNEKKFEDNFDNFVAIICKYSPESALGSEFCDFFELKIRLKLLDIDEPIIDYCHVRPERIINSKRCPQRFRKAPIQNDKDLCVIWVVGIKLKEEAIFEKIKLEAAIHWKEPLKQQIAKVKEDFFGQLPKNENSSWKEEKKQMEAIFRFISSREGLRDAIKIESDEFGTKEN